MIDHRKFKTFGSLLADQDLENEGLVSREQFFRCIDSLQFALGEGDILDLIRGYAKGEKVDIQRLRDDLNDLIVTSDCKIQLRSVLNQLIGERVVDHIEEGTPRNGNSLMGGQKVDPKMLQAFKDLSVEITCGLFVREVEGT